jgi:hypothetical protein
MAQQGSINIVLMSRHVYRKGIDLVVGMIPIVCKQCPEAYFILGGKSTFHDRPLAIYLEFTPWFLPSVLFMFPLVICVVHYSQVMDLSA